MSRFPTFKQTNVLPGLCKSMLILVRSRHPGLITVRQDLQSPPPAAPPSPALQASQSFGHKPLPYSPWLTARHSPGAFALQGLIDQSVSSVFSPVSRPYSTGSTVHQTHVTRQHHWSLCRPPSPSACTGSAVLHSGAAGLSLPVSKSHQTAPHSSLSFTLSVSHTRLHFTVLSCHNTIVIVTQ